MTDDQASQQRLFHDPPDYRRRTVDFVRALRTLMMDNLVLGRRLRLQQAAASLAFLSLLAAVPVLSIALAVLAALPVFDRLVEDLQGFLYGNLFPDAFNESVIERLNEFASRARGLSSLGAAAFFITAIAALRVIERTMNQIWGVRSRRSFFMRLGLYWVLLTLGPILLGLTVVLSTDLIADGLNRVDAPALRSAWFSAVPWLTGGAVIWLLFMTLPAARVVGVHALAGAAVSVALIAVLQEILTTYLQQLPTYEVVYGAFAVLPIFLIWLFLVWIAFLVGALVAANLRHWGRPLQPFDSDVPGQRFGDACVAIEALKEASGGRLEVALRAMDLRGLLDNDPVRLEALALLLEETGYIIRFLPLAELSVRAVARPRFTGAQGDRVELWSERWAWREDPRSLSLRRLFDRLWWGEGAAGLAQKRFGVPSDFLDSPLVDARDSLTF